MYEQIPEYDDEEEEVEVNGFNYSNFMKSDLFRELNFSYGKGGQKDDEFQEMIRKDMFEE